MTDFEENLFRELQLSRIVIEQADLEITSLKRTKARLRRYLKALLGRCGSVEECTDCESTYCKFSAKAKASEDEGFDEDDEFEDEFDDLDQWFED